MYRHFDTSSSIFAVPEKDFLISLKSRLLTKFPDISRGKVNSLTFPWLYRHPVITNIFLLTTGLPGGGGQNNLTSAEISDFQSVTLTMYKSASYPYVENRNNTAENPGHFEYFCSSKNIPTHKLSVWVFNQHVILQFDMIQLPIFLFNLKIPWKTTLLNG